MSFARSVAMMSWLALWRAESSPFRRNPKGSYELHKGGLYGGLHRGVL